VEGAGKGRDLTWGGSRLCRTGAARGKEGEVDGTGGGVGGKEGVYGSLGRARCGNSRVGRCWTWSLGALARYKNIILTCGKTSAGNENALKYALRPCEIYLSGPCVH
jgi:hypothetical protein